MGERLRGDRTRGVLFLGMNRTYAPNLHMINLPSPSHHVVLIPHTDSQRTFCPAGNISCVSSPITENLIITILPTSNKAWMQPMIPPRLNPYSTVLGGGNSVRTPRSQAQICRRVLQDILPDTDGNATGVFATREQLTVASGKTLPQRRRQG